MFHLPSTRTAVKARARFADDGRLLALVADAEGPLDFLNVAEGEAPLTREQIAAHIAELDTEACAAIIDAARAEAAAIDPNTATSETVDRINALGDAVDEATTRQTAIAEATAAQQAAAAAALARLSPPADDAGDQGDDDQGDDDNADDGADAQATPEPIAASGGNTPRARRGSALPRPGAAGGMGATTQPARTTAPPAAYTAPRAQVALVAAAGLDSVAQGGTAVEDRRTIGNLFAERLEQVRRGRGADGDQLSVVQVRTSYPEDRRLTSTGTDLNTTRIREATTREALVAAGQHVATTRPGALVAAGGLCGPIEQLNDVPVLGSTARPFRDALANFGADRGGVKWREHLSFGDFADAIGFWTLADDAAVTGDPATEPKTKPCATVECPGEVDAYVEAITFCLEFSNVTSRFDPESTAANVSAAQIAHARIAENRLMAQVAALSTTVTNGDEVLGTVRDTLTFLDNLLAQYQSFYRLDEAVALRMTLPQWFRRQCLSDLTRGMAGDLDALAVADATINGWFQRRGVNLSWHLDGRPTIAGGVGVPAMAAQSYGAFTPGGPVAPYPAQVEAFLWVEGDMLHLDGGTLDLGVVRDASLNSVNRYKTFSESWEGVAHRGVEAIRGVLTTTPTGMVAGTRDTAAILGA